MEPQKFIKRKETIGCICSRTSGKLITMAEGERTWSGSPWAEHTIHNLLIRVGDVAITINFMNIKPAF